MLDKFTTLLKLRRRTFLDGSACTRKYELSSFMVKDIYGGNHSFLVLHDLAGSELLDPQYDEYPADISRDDFRHYFEPIALTDATGGPADWLKPYVPQSRKKPRPVLSDAREAVSAHALVRTKGEIAARHELH